MVTKDFLCLAVKDVKYFIQMTTRAALMRSQEAKMKHFYFIVIYFTHLHRACYSTTCALPVHNKSLYFVVCVAYSSLCVVTWITQAEPGILKSLGSL